MSVNPMPLIIVRFADDLGPFERITSTIDLLPFVVMHVVSFTMFDISHVSHTVIWAMLSLFRSIYVRSPAILI